MTRADWKRVAGYGLALAAGTLALEWLDYQRLARTPSEELYVLVVAGGFLALGLYLGARGLRRVQPAPFDGNPQAQAALGITAREFDVLQLVAAGRTNKEIAARLQVAPDTVKTHVARLYGKLGVRRRTEAVGRARELGILP